MIGDNPVHDVAGGRAAGLRTIWLRRPRSVAFSIDKSAWIPPAIAGAFAWVQFRA